MRRREKFVVASVVSTLGLIGVQYTFLEIRYIAIAIFVVFTYLISTWALADDLQPHERFTIIPFTAIYAAAVSLFYFLLPESFISQAAIVLLFGVGMYALFLTSNIFSVAKGRTIQLVHAANAISGLFGVLISLLFSNTVFSLKLPFYLNMLLIGLVHLPLIFMLLWSVNLENRVEKDVVGFSMVLTLVLMELALVLSFFPLGIWYYALFIMSFFYIGIGLMQSFIRGRLFVRILVEYSLVAGFVGIVFLSVVPFK
ncbi:MAG: hypothetical protein BroJett025_01380 [Patescibacteria group bacterium]|nr:MAG: hypothetical protein BroJett025_01380 [Patescibacteria group bacterium]